MANVKLSDLPENLQSIGKAMLKLVKVPREERNPTSILLVGAPGVGTTMLVRRVAVALKPLAYAQPEIEEIYQLASVGEHDRQIPEVPLRMPHYTVSSAGMRGAWHQKSVAPHPGELSLAHGGVLLLDEVSEFRKQVLEDVKGARYTGVVEYWRSGGKVHTSYPAVFTLIGATHPCPCGFAGHPDRHCDCSESALKRYNARHEELVYPLFKHRIDVPVRSLADGILAKKTEPSVQQLKSRLSK
jgi:magnesium chelatase family protein